MGQFWSTSVAKVKLALGVQFVCIQRDDHLKIGPSTGHGVSVTNDGQHVS